MSDLLLHDDTQKQVTDFLTLPAHALIIEGFEGSGKHSLSDYIAAGILEVDEDALNRAHLLRIEAVNNSISIDEIRRAQQFMKLKTLGDKPIRRILSIDGAENLTIEAQNAFLKLLEEPPTDTVVLLTTTNITALLPTIRSRAQLIHVKPLNLQVLSDYFAKQGFKSADILRAFYISDGRIGLMHSLLIEDSTDNQLVENIDLAKQLLVMPKFERLTQVDNLVKQKSQIAQLLKALETLCQAGLVQASEKDDTKLIKRWHKSLSSVIETQSYLLKNPNPKLLLTNLLLNL